MSSLFAINSLVEWVSISGGRRVERILYISPNCEKIATIDVTNTKRGVPEVCDYEELRVAMESETARLIHSDPWSVKNIPEEDIPEHHRRRRDKAWTVVAPIVDQPSSVVFDTKKRYNLIQTVRRSTGASEKVIYTYLRRYWQGGQTRNALLPAFSSAPKPEKQPLEKRKRRGRRSILEDPNGILIGEDEKGKFEAGLRAFYLKENKPSLRSAFHRTLERFFNRGFNVKGNKTVPQLPPAHLLPTYWQFRYWFRHQRQASHTLIKREGAKRYNLRHRPLIGNTNALAFGPGSLYQIDSTIADIYLVSALNRATIVGRPLLYLVMDVFSRCITGFHLSLENASYAEAALAIENAVTNKVEYCQSLGENISPGEWPCRHLPEALVADRGELEGILGDNLVSALGVRLDNTPPYRADMKGIVERHFRTGNQRLIHWLPGAVQKQKERGDRDHRVEATLDIHQLTKLVIYWILEHNRRRLTQYNFDEFQIQGAVEATPLALWKWGTENRSGALRTMSRDLVRLNLLPKGQASVSRKGLRFKKAYYSCETAMREEWFVRAGTRSWKIPICYDPRNANVIYLQSKNQNEAPLESCQLLSRDTRFAHKNWVEVERYFAAQARENTTAKGEELQSEASYQSKISNIVAEAATKTKKFPTNESKAVRVRGIRQNRKDEAQRLRGTSSIPESAAAPAADSNPDYVGPASRMDLLRELQRQRHEKD